MGAKLDIGRYTAAGGDVVDFIRKHQDKIANLHLKDRERNSPGATVEDGATVPREGDTPILDALVLLQHEKYPVPALIEYEYKGTDDSVIEVKKCFQYCRDVLA